MFMITSTAARTKVREKNPTQQIFCHHFSLHLSGVDQAWKVPASEQRSLLGSSSSHVVICRSPQKPRLQKMSRRIIWTLLYHLRMCSNKISSLVNRKRNPEASVIYSSPSLLLFFFSFSFLSNHGEPHGLAFLFTRLEFFV